MRIWLTFAFFLFTSLIIGQEQWFSGSLYSNVAYYVDDDKTGDFDEKNRFRSNNYLKLDAGFGKLSFGIQLEGYSPQPVLNFNPKYNKELGIGIFRAEYRSDKLVLTAGHFYEQFGSGLILRSWEDRELGLNNAIRGGKIDYTPVPFWQVKALYGNHRTGFNVAEGEIFAANSELNLTHLMKIDKATMTFGLSYVGRKQPIDLAVAEFDETTHAFSGRLNYSGNKLYSSIEYLSKSPDALVEFESVRTQNTYKGNALLINLGYSEPGFGMDAVFRRIEHLDFYADREVAGNIYNDRLLNYVPGLTRQHDYGLANIYVYQAQSGVQFIPLGKAGEIGTQFDLFYYIKKGTAMGGKYGTKLAINYASWSGLNATFNAADRTYEADFLNYGEKYYSDFNIEIRKKWSSSWSSIMTFIDLFYSKKYIEETSGEVNASIGIVESTYKFSSGKSLRLEAQHLWTKDDQRNWWSATTELNLSSKISIFVSDMYNYGNDLRKVHYFNFGGSYAKNRTRVSLNYGRQRGGLICVGGVCRVVPESTGFNIVLNTSF